MDVESLIGGKRPSLLPTVLGSRRRGEYKQWGEKKQVRPQKTLPSVPLPYLGFHPVTGTYGTC